MSTTDASLHSSKVRYKDMSTAEAYEIVRVYIPPRLDIKSVLPSPPV